MTDMVAGIRGKAIDAWVGSLRAEGRSEDTIRVRRHYVNRVLSDISVSPWLVTTEQLEQWLAEQRWGASTRRSAVASLRGFFGWALERGHRTDDPARFIRPPKSPRPCPKPMPEGALHEALRNADEDTRWLLRLLASTGLRRSEAAALHRADLEGDWLRVTGKGGITRRVPVPPDVRDWIASKPGYVFPGRFGGHVGREWVTATVTKATGGYGPHTLRHRYATRAYAASHDLRAVQRLLGHASIATTQMYVDSGDRAALDAASAAWDAA